MNALKKIWLLAPVAILGAACGKSAPDDAALKNDLALASQQQFMPAQVMSPTEQGLTANPYVAPVRRTTASAPRATTVRRTSTAPRSTSAGTYEPAPQPEVVVKHTKRDAAIGAAAGAIIGATTSRDKVKGAIIGGVAGGILGAVIGNNVDVQRKPGGYR